MNNFLLLGCGNLGNIILEGLLSQNKKVYVFEKKKSITQKLVHKNCLVTNKIDSNLISKIDCILLCTKPVDVKNLLQQLLKLKNEFQKSILISFVAGIKINSILNIISNKNQKIVRVMPNIFIKFRKSSTGILSKNINLDTKEKIETLFSFFGYLVWLRKEEDFDFFTAMYGGGPAYFLFILKCLKEISYKNSIKKKDTTKLLLKLLEGTVEILKTYPENFETFIYKVMSKGGTTEEAMNYLTKNKTLFKKLENALEKAREKSKSLSKKY